ncbi:MAG TPA: M23 family metallopeptidase [Gemmatimonadaceae bacterium]|nr:M23 family metallopeptidase [Gemmatimonadaceae bacterium]
MTRWLSLLVTCVIGLSEVAAQQPPARLTVRPSSPTPGSVVRITFKADRDSITSLTGEIGDQALHFRKYGAEWRALGGVSVDAMTTRVRVVAERSSGTTDTTTVLLTPPPRRAGTSRPSRLSVSSRFTRPLDSATQARIDRENEMAREVGRRAHLSPARWTTSFLKPRTSRVTSNFGTGRTFNGTVTSRHLGVDFSGGIGAPVRAANRGVVALVDTFFLAGRVIYIDHGGGVVTGYFHLSKTLVETGDTVERGQEIGLIGATGRVTGPHLHWTARYGPLTVNPLDLVLIGDDWYSGPSASGP